jgi:internalin A
LRWVLHCLGIALNYSDDVRLRETSVLKPEWVTEGIYSILDARKIAERQGELHLDDLRQLLPARRYPEDKHLFLLELMRKFSLCFAFPDEEKRYLIPELLGKEEPLEAAAFPPGGCLNFEYHYGVLPEGLIPRFIVRSNTLSRGQGRWRTGAILAYEECKALVKAEPAERRVIVRIKDGNAGARRSLLAIIRYDFDRINAEFKDRLDAQPKVPLTDFPEFAVDYKKLVAFERQGVPQFPEFIGDRVVMVHVAELLNGVDLEKQRSLSLETFSQAKAVFFSYSHKDEWLRDELETHLKLLQRQGIISTWHDRKLLPGSEWDHEIDAHLERAQIILLLVSADFLASDYCWDKEVRRAVERHEAGEATVIPILLRSCEWKGAPFEKIQGLPKDLTPVTASKDRDAAWTAIASGIRAVAESLRDTKGRN